MALQDSSNQRSYKMPAMTVTAKGMRCTLFLYTLYAHELCHLQHLSLLTIRKHKAARVLREVQQGLQKPTCQFLHLLRTCQKDTAQSTLGGV